MHRRNQSAVNMSSRNGYDLFDAAAKGDLLRTKACVEAGATIEFHNANERTPLMIACLTGKTDVVKYLVEKGADINAVTPDHWSPLFIAAYNGHFAIVEYLISQKAPVEVVDTIGWTPLISATHNGHASIVRLLLKNKADVFQITNEGLSAHIIARNREFNDIAEMLLQAETKQRALFSERLDIQDPLPAPGGEVNPVTGEVHTFGNPQAHAERQRLLKQDRDLANELTWQGAFKGHIQSIYLGIDQGADPLYRGAHDYNCIEAAKLSGNRRCCQFLQAVLLFQTRRVKYWTPDDVLLYLEGTLPLHLPSAHMRQSVQDYNAQHPYVYRYIDDVLAHQHIPGEKCTSQFSKPDDSCGAHNSHVRTTTNPANTNNPVPDSPQAPVHVSTTHPYIIVYNDLMDQEMRQDEELANLGKGRSQVQNSNTTDSHHLHSHEEIDQRTINISSNRNSPNQKDEQRNMGEIIEILDGPINGYVLTSPKFFSLLDTFTGLTWEEKRALHSAALCLRHGSPFPHHIRQMFSDYASQFISTDHALDLTSFSEIQLYLQTFKDIISGAHNLSGNAASQQPLIPILIIDEPLDPAVFNPGTEDQPYVPHSAATPGGLSTKSMSSTGSMGVGKGFGPSASTGNTAVTAKQTPGTTTAITTPAGELTMKSDSLDKLRRERAQLSLQWWKFLEYDHVVCSPNGCQRCRVDPNHLFDQSLTQASSTITAFNTISNSSTPLPPGAAATPASSTAMNNVPIVIGATSPPQVHLPLTISTTTTTKELQSLTRTKPKSEHILPTPSTPRDGPAPGPLALSLDVISPPNDHEQQHPHAQGDHHHHHSHHHRIKTVTTTTTTTHVLGSISSTYHHSRRIGSSSFTPLAYYRANIGFEQAYEHLTLKQQYMLAQNTATAAHRLVVNPNKIQAHADEKKPPACGFQLKNPTETHNFRLQLLCDGLFALPALSTANRRSLHTCNQHHQGYEITLTNAQLLLIAPYLIYSTWILGLHSSVTTALLNLRGLLDDYPVPTTFEPTEYIQQHSTSISDKANSNHSTKTPPPTARLATKTAPGSSHHEPNLLGFCHANQRFIDYCTQVITKAPKACVPSFIPAVDKNLFQIRSKYFTVPIEALTDRPIPRDPDTTKPKYGYLYNTIPIVLPQRLLDRIAAEMKQDQDRASADQQNEPVEVRTQPKSAAWRALQKAMLDKKFHSDDSTETKPASSPPLPVIGETKAPVVDAIPETAATTTPTLPQTNSAHSSTTTIEPVNLADARLHTAVSADDDRPHHQIKTINNAELSNSASVYSHSSSSSSHHLPSPQPPTNQTVPAKPIITVIPIKPGAGDGTLEHTIHDIEPPSSRPQSSSSTGSNDEFDPSRLSAHQKDILTRTIRLIQSPAGRRKSAISLDSDGNRISGRLSGAVFNSSGLPPQLTNSLSGGGLDDIDGTGHDQRFFTPTKRHANATKSPMSPNADAELDSTDPVQTPNHATRTPAFARRASRTFESFELIDQSRLSKMGSLLNPEAGLQSPHNLQSLGTSNSNSTVPKSVPTYQRGQNRQSSVKQRLLNRNKQSGLLLLGQRVLRDVEVICEGNSKQSLLEIALLLGLKDKRTPKEQLQHQHDTATNTPKTGFIQPFLANTSNAVAFDISWMAELHLMVEHLGIKAYCSDVGNLPSMVNFFTTFHGTYFHTQSYYQNLFGPNNESTIVLQLDQDDNHPSSPGSPLPRNPFVSRFSEHSPHSNTKTNNKHATSTTLCIGSEPSEPATMVNMNSFFSLTPEPSKRDLLIDTHTPTNSGAIQTPLSPVVIPTTNTVTSTVTTVQPKASQNGHHCNNPPQNHLRVHNTSTTTTTTQQNPALLVTTTTVVDVIDSSSSDSEGDSDEDDEYGVSTSTLPSSTTSTASNHGRAKSVSLAATPGNMPAATGIASQPTSPTAAENATTSPPPTTIFAISSTNATANIVTPSTPTLAINVGPNPALLSYPNSPVISLFEATQLLSNPFVRAKAILFQDISAKTHNNTAWTPQKHITSNLALLSDKSEGKAWFMCESHCHLAIELDPTRFEQQHQVNYAEKVADVKVTSLAAALGFGAQTKTPVNEDIDSDEELFVQAKKNPKFARPPAATTTSKPATAGKNGAGDKDKEKCVIM